MFGFEELSAQNLQGKESRKDKKSTKKMKTGEENGSISPDNYTPPTNLSEYQSIYAPSSNNTKSMDAFKQTELNGKYATDTRADWQRSALGPIKASRLLLLLLRRLSAVVELLLPAVFELLLPLPSTPKTLDCRFGPDFGFIRSSYNLIKVAHIYCCIGPFITIR